MDLVDILLSPIMFFLIYGIGAVYRNYNMDDLDPKRKYFMWGLHAKMIGTFATAFIYWHYYGAGDSLWYHWRAEYLRHFMSTRPGDVLSLIFFKPDLEDPSMWRMIKSMKAFDMSSFMVVRIAFFCSYPAFKSYLLIAMMFSALAYIGIWALFKKSVELFPDVDIKYLAMAVLFIPSVFFWGSGLFKDTVTLGFTCLMIVSFHNLFMKRKQVILNASILLISAYFVGTIKGYIILALVPAAMIWLVYSVKNQIKSDFIRKAITPVFLVASVFIGVIILQELGSVFTKFNLENIESKAEGMQRWHARRSEGGGSGYSLGHVEFTASGILRKAPAAINVALFRPYLWESRNPVVLFSAVESVVFLYLFIRLFIFNMFFSFRQIRKEPFLMFCLVFTMVFAFSVGFTSYNFGALVRYKIPCLPTFGIILAVIWSRNKDRKASKLEEKKEPDPLAPEKLEVVEQLA